MFVLRSIAVTSHDASVLCAGTLDNITGNP